jgi:nicotinamide-nucleotide amidase
MRAELLAVGSELLGALRVDTNSLWLTERLLEAGIVVAARSTVADERTLLESALRSTLARADVVITTGGLGPTADDLTRESAAAALGRRLLRDEGLLEGLRARFARFGRVMSPTNAQQADVIEGARVLPNSRGTAPGQLVEADGTVLVLLPGPPGEMKPMFEEQVLPELRSRAGARVVRTRVLRIAGMGESNVDQVAAPVYRRFDNPRTTILGAAGQVELHLVGEGESEASVEERIEALARELRAALPGRIFSEDGRELPEVVASLLRERGLTLAVAESCTGGLLTARLTDVPGASAFLERSFVTYSNRAKHEELGVETALVERVGAVSEEVAAAMASGVRRVAGTSIGIGITGIAGPDGGTADKPVGLVYVALDAEGSARVRRGIYPGGRKRVRYQATQVALEMLRRDLLGLEEMP